MPSLNFSLVPTIVTDSTVLASAASVIRAGLHERRAAAELSFTGGDPDFGFFVFSGLELLADRLERFWLTDADRALLRMQSWLDPGARETIDALRCTLDIDAPPEGSLVFAREPIVMVEGPLVAVLLAMPLVTRAIGLGTMVATRAARMALAARAGAGTQEGDEIVDASSSLTLGDAGLLAARAAYVGGCASTTNLAAAQMLGLPTCRTAAPAIERLCQGNARDRWGGAAATLESKSFVSGGGAKGEELELVERRRGGERGIWLARELAAELAPSTDEGDGGEGPAVRYDIVALEQGRSWSPRLGAGSDPRVLPGRKQVVRYVDAAGAQVADLVQLAAERVPVSAHAELIAYPDPGFARALPAGLASAPLQRAVLRGGKRAGAAEHAVESRRRAAAALAALSPAMKRLRSPARYRVGISRGLFDLRTSLLLA